METDVLIIGAGPTGLMMANQEHWKKLGVTSELFLLLRPDNYIAYVFENYEEEKFKDYLSTYFALN